jgi:hypothetical protein
VAVAVVQQMVAVAVLVASVQLLPQLVAVVHLNLLYL